VVPRTDRGRRVQQRIFADRPQCVAVVGDPRIGKSTFLDWLEAAAKAEDPAPPAGTRFVRLGLSGAASASPSNFLRDVLEFVRTAPVAGEEPTGRTSTLPGSTDASPRTYAAFESEIQTIAKEGGRLILLLDDFDRVTTSQAFPSTFFSFLRAQANSFPVAYVTTSRQDLQQLCVLKEVEESPFFNIFQNLNLGPLDETNTRALAAERAPSVDAKALGDWTCWPVPAPRREMARPPRWTPSSRRTSKSCGSTSTRPSRRCCNASPRASRPENGTRDRCATSVLAADTSRSRTGSGCCSRRRWAGSSPAARERTRRD
jgi:hypothetical protein